MLPLPGEHRRQAAAGLGGGVRQPPDAVRLHGGLEQQYVPPARVLPGNGGKRRLLQVGLGAPGGRELRFQPRHGGGGVPGLDAEALGNGAGLVIDQGEVLQPHPLPEFLAGEDLDKAHLPRLEDMGAAAGAAVRPGKGDDAHFPGELLLAAVVQGRQLLRRGIGDLHRPVRPDSLIGQPLRLQSLLPGDPGVVVDGHRLRPQVEAHIVAAEFFAQDAGDDVLAGVLLHVVKAAVPVDGPHHHCAGFQRAVTGVENHAVSLMDIRHTHAA